MSHTHHQINRRYCNRSRSTAGQSNLGFTPFLAHFRSKPCQGWLSKHTPSRPSNSSCGCANFPDHTCKSMLQEHMIAMPSWAYRCYLGRSHAFASQQKFPYFFLVFSGFLGPFSVVGRRGGQGIIPAWPSSRATVSVGCAPTDSQYLLPLTKPLLIGP